MVSGRTKRIVFANHLLTRSQPRLVAVSGPLKGSMFPLAEGDWSVGRLAGNALFLDDSGVSRHHCIFIAKARAVSSAIWTAITAR